MRNTLLAIAMIAVLVACSDQDETAAQQPQAAPEPAAPTIRTSAEPAEAPAPAPTPASAPSTPDEAAFWARFDGIAAAAHRSDKNRARDVYRHPRETLQFFGIGPGMRVVEIWPGGGWYTEIIAPLLRGNGTLVAAYWDDTIKGQPEYRYKLANEFKSMMWNFPDVYDQVQLENFTPPSETALGEPGSADAVLTFRNVHNWIENKSAPAVFKSFHEVLKPGGVLGVVEHRAAAGKSAEESSKSGYLSEDAVVKLATDAGFTLVAKSEINANPKDTKDHPEGVWTLPPSLALGEKDREKYLAIGESDRMTLKFEKPAASIK